MMYQLQRIPRVVFLGGRVGRGGEGRAGCAIVTE